MKNILILMIVAFASLSLKGQIVSANLQASGLTCSMCSNSIFKSLKVIDFVESVESDVENSSFKILFKANENVDLDALQKAVVGAGFSVAKMTFMLRTEALDIKDRTLVEIGDKLFYFINTKDRTLKGEVELRLLDKEFNSSKEYKKVKSKLYSDSEKRVFNVTI